PPSRAGTAAAAEGGAGDDRALQQFPHVAGRIRGLAGEPDRGHGLVDIVVGRGDQPVLPRVHRVQEPDGVGAARRLEARVAVVGVQLLQPARGLAGNTGPGVLDVHGGILSSPAVIPGGSPRRFVQGGSAQGASSSPSRAAWTSQRHSRSTQARPFSPIARARSGSVRSPVRACARRATERPGTTSPVSPSRTASGAPPESPATTGSPVADASR